MEEIFWEVHSDNKQEGPGCLESTKKAFEMLKDVPDTPHILVIGCGPGREVIDLANISNAQITAVENHEPYLKQLEARAEAANISDRIEIVLGDMFDMKFEDGTFDIIWIEGALYFIGVEKGLKEWKRFLKPGGYVCFTELCWLKENAPEEIRGFFKEGYPQMKNVQDNLEFIKNAEYEVINHFTTPEKAWFDYCNPIEEKIKHLRKKHKEDKKALEYLDIEEREIEMYKKYSEWYGYEFFLTKSV